MQDKLPALVLAACHFIPLIAYEVWFVGLGLQNEALAQIAPAVGLILAFLLQVVAFMTLSKLLEKIEPGASETTVQ